MLDKSTSFSPLNISGKKNHPHSNTFWMQWILLTQLHLQQIFHILLILSPDKNSKVSTFYQKEAIAQQRQKGIISLLMTVKQAAHQAEILTAISEYLLSLLLLLDQMHIGVYHWAWTGTIQDRIHLLNQFLWNLFNWTWDEHSLFSSTQNCLGLRTTHITTSWWRCKYLISPLQGNGSIEELSTKLWHNYSFI